MFYKYEFVWSSKWVLNFSKTFTKNLMFKKSNLSICLLVAVTTLGRFLYWNEILYCLQVITKHEKLNINFGKS